MDLTKNEILRVKTKGTLNIIPASPLHDAIISAMDYYAKQESLSFVNWLSNQDIDGEHLKQLWGDYQEECSLSDG